MVKPLSQFLHVSPSDLRDLFGRIASKLFILKARQWFVSRDGLKSVRELLNALSSDPSHLPPWEGEIASLQDLEVLLVAASSKEILFHLYLG